MSKKILLFLCWCYLQLIIKTARATIIGRENVEQDDKIGRSVVYCCPHHFLLGLFVGIEAGGFHRPKTAVIISLSRDGDLIAHLVKKLGYEVVRGSSRRGAQKAMHQLVRIGQEGKSLGLAFDGPKGPPLVPKRGLIGCLRATNGSLYLIHGKARACRLLPFLKPFSVNSWDRFLVPVPFCRLEVHFEKIPVEQIQLEEQEDVILKKIESRSKEVFGHIYPDQM